MKNIKKYMRNIKIIIFLFLLVEMACCMTILPGCLICNMVITNGFTIAAFLIICGKCLLLYFIFALLTILLGSKIWKD